MPTKSLRIIHVTTSLLGGGAEAILFQLCKASSRNGFNHRVISLRDLGVYGPRLIANGVPVTALNMPRSRLTISGLRLLRRTIFRYDPDLVQTWQYHGDLLGGIVARSMGYPTVWGIHNSNLDLRYTSRATRSVARACAMVSNIVPKAIACCSIEAIRVHRNLGYTKNRFIAIPNGYDCNQFRPNEQIRNEIRLSLGVDPNEHLLGMVARWDPQKDHSNLLNSLRMVLESGQALKCILVGPGMTSSNSELSEKLSSLGLHHNVFLLGMRNDIPDIMNALDIHILSSAYGEAFPNVLAEAMACGTPCITSDVGDAGLIVGDSGWVVPPKDSKQLADSILVALREKMAAVNWNYRKAYCRNRIKTTFSLKRMVNAYQRLWQEVVGKKG